MASETTSRPRARTTAPPALSLAAKLAKIRAELPTIETRGHAHVQTAKANYSYDYLQEEDLMAAIAPRLAAERVAAVYSDEVLRVEQGMTTVRVYWTLIDGDSGERLELRSDGTGTDYGDKGANKAKTSAMRYLLWKTFLVPSNESSEAEQQHVTRDDAAKQAADRQAEDERRRQGQAARGAARRTPADNRPRFRSAIAQRASELDELRGVIQGSTFTELCDQLAQEELSLDTASEASLVALGQALAKHLEQERLSDAESFAFRVPAALVDSMVAETKEGRS